MRRSRRSSGCSGPTASRASRRCRPAGRSVCVGAWRMHGGPGADLPAGHRPRAERSGRSGADAPAVRRRPELRLRQEWILGVGGVRVLRALGNEPAAWHANEGHAAFMLLERVRELTGRGVTFDDAVEQVRATSVFTTHTPVPGGPRHLLGRAARSVHGPDLERDAASAARRCSTWAITRRAITDDSTCPCSRSGCRAG